MAINNKNKTKQYIVKDLNLGNLTVLQQNKIIAGLMDNISARISIAVLDRLSVRQREELQRISKQDKKRAVLAYLDSKIKNFSALAEKISVQTIKDFKKLRD